MVLLYPWSQVNQLQYNPYGDRGYLKKGENDIPVSGYLLNAESGDFTVGKSIACL